MQHPRFVLLAAAALSFAGVSSAAAQKKAVKACGISAIPLSVGNSWTYENTEYPPPTRGTDGEKAKEQESRDNAAKLYPNPATKIVITVTAVTTAKDTGITTVALTEAVDDRTIETTLTCTASSLTASVDSFFYAGEPGGSFNLGFTDLERKGPTLPIVGGRLSGTEWHDDFKAKWKREASKDTTADLGAGTITIKRRMVLVQEEPALEMPAGSWAKSNKIGIETSGNVTIDNVPEGAKPYELPAGLVSWMYLVDGVGLARVENAFFHAYQLTTFTVAK